MTIGESKEARERPHFYCAVRSVGTDAGDQDDDPLTGGQWWRTDG